MQHIKKKPAALASDRASENTVLWRDNSEDTAHRSPFQFLNEAKSRNAAAPSFRRPSQAFAVLWLCRRYRLTPGRARLIAGAAGLGA